MTIYFQTPAEFDLRALTVFGAHAKPNSSSPIGHFGTGLKFAVATLARAGCHIVLSDPRTGLDVSVTSQSTQFRGSEMGELALAGTTNVLLPFTIELGKNWTPLMAYRELVSNTRDENGAFGQKMTLNNCFTIAVTGKAIEQAYDQHSKMFLDEPKIIETIGGIQICHKHPEGGAFYRGVRVGDLGKSKFTYNFTQALTLTEDRTIDTGTLKFHLGTALLRAKTQIVREALCLSPLKHNELLEPNLLFFGSLAPQFAELIIERYESGHLMNDRLTSLAYRTLDRLPKRKVHDLRQDQEELLAKAIEVLRFNGVVLQHSVKIYQNREQGVFGLADRLANELIVSPEVFDNGLSFLVAVIYEEHLHLTRGFNDETRAMQLSLVTSLGSAYVELAKLKGLKL